MADYHYAIPHRKPVGQPAPRIIAPDQHLRQPPAPAAQTQSRIISSTVYPANPNNNSPSNYTQTVSHSRRTLSTATASSTSSGGPGQVPSVSINLRRSSSSRSGQSIAPTSYVALMRKQKATVWCDRSQHEDPRIMAQQKAAKMRATVEVLGNGNRNSTGGSMNSSSVGVRSKIRHHGAPKAAAYSPATLLVGTSGVPMRLSASEVDGEDNSDEDDDSQRRAYTRTGSGRSSLASGHRLTVYPRPAGRLSQGSTPPSGQSGSPADPPVDTPDAAKKATSDDYFQQPSGTGSSGSSGERENSFGNVGDLAGPSAKVPEVKNAQDLSRRGSVDERSMTMRGPRLFVANPDLSD